MFFPWVYKLTGIHSARISRAKLIMLTCLDHQLGSVFEYVYSINSFIKIYQHLNTVNYTECVTTLNSILFLRLQLSTPFNTTCYPDTAV